MQVTVINCNLVLRGMRSVFPLVADLCIPGKDCSPLSQSRLATHFPKLSREPSNGKLHRISYGWNDVILSTHNLKAGIPSCNSAAKVPYDH